MGNGVTDEQVADAKEIRAVLQKFEGNPSQEEIDAGEATLVETIIIEYDEDGNPKNVQKIDHRAEGGD